MRRTDVTRKQHSRDHLHFPSDLTALECTEIAPFIPPAKPGGRPRQREMTEAMNAVLCLACSSGWWQTLPKDSPPASTVRGYFLILMRYQVLAGHQSCPCRRQSDLGRWPLHA